MVEGFKKNEEQLKHYVAEYKTKLKNQDQVIDCHPLSQLSFSNSQIAIFIEYSAIIMKFLAV